VRPVYILHVFDIIIIDINVRPVYILHVFDIIIIDINVSPVYILHVFDIIIIDINVSQQCNWLLVGCLCFKTMLRYSLLKGSEI